ncbi:ABC transporter permease subunit [Dactylosporangium salmoneum]|uniref:ABC transporter permease n=1 Tax=Dactylosporangium salmoneum TaxID=53361 RepID=A0ABN3FEY7_9ACTN
MRSEIRKLTTVRAPWLLLAAALVLVAAGAGSRLARHPEDSAGAAAHAGLAALFPLVLGITALAGEYRHRTIADTYLSTPRRGRVLLDKLVVHALVGAGFGVAGGAVALLLVEARGTGGVPWSTLAGAVGWNAAFAAIGVAVGALVRNQVAAIAGSLAWLALIEGVAAELLGDAARWLPFRAATSLGGMDAGLSQGTAAAVLAAYVLVLTAAAVAVRQRDL